MPSSTSAYARQQGQASTYTSSPRKPTSTPAPRAVGNGHMGPGVRTPAPPAYAGGGPHNIAITPSGGTVRMPAPTGAAATSIAANRYQPVNAYLGLTAPTGPGDYSAEELAQMILNNGKNLGTTTSGGGGSRRRGSGGSSGSGAASTAQAAAYKALLAQMTAGDGGIGAAYDQMDAATRAAYDPAAINGRWDTAGGAIRNTAADSEARLAGILSDLNARNAQGRADQAAVFAQGGADLTGLQNQFQGQQASQAGQANDILNRFGAGPVDTSGADASLRNLFAAGQVGNSRAATVNDAAQLDRGNVANALGSDVRNGITSQAAALQNRIAMQRQADLQANQQQLAQLLGQSGVARAQANKAHQDEINQVRLQLASMGITV